MSNAIEPRQPSMRENHESSEQYVRSMRLRFRQQAARFLQDVSEDVGSVLAQDAAMYDGSTKMQLYTLQQGITNQVTHMNKIIERERLSMAAAAKKKQRAKKEIKFTEKELKTLRDIASKEDDPDGVVSDRSMCCHH